MGFKKLWLYFLSLCYQLPTISLVWLTRRRLQTQTLTIKLVLPGGAISLKKLGGPGRIPNAVVDRVTARLLSQHDFVLAKHNNPPVKSTHKQNIKSVNTLQYQEFESRHYTHWKSFFKLLGWRPSIYLIFVFYLNFGQLKIITPFAHPEW